MKKINYTLLTYITANFMAAVAVIMLVVAVAVNINLSQRTMQKQDAMSMKLDSLINDYNSI